MHPSLGQHLAPTNASTAAKPLFKYTPAGCQHACQQKVQRPQSQNRKYVDVYTDKCDRGVMPKTPPG